MQHSGRMRAGGARIHGCGKMSRAALTTGWTGPQVHKQE